MSGAQTPPPGPAGGNDPSMEDILASIRRILSEEEPAPAASSAQPAATSAPPVQSDGVLVLDASMMVPEEPEITEAEPPPAPALAALPVPAPPPPVPARVAEPVPPTEEVSSLVAPEAAAAAASAIGSLMRTLAAQQTVHVRPGGPTIEDIVREELRPMLKQWLDINLPPMVERLVRAEIERVVGRSVG